MTDKPDTKTQIIQTAEKLLRKSSFNSFSYRDISEEVGIKKASIHYHFPTKDILGVKVVQNFHEKIKYLMDKLEKQTSDPMEKLNAYFDFFRSGLKQDLICPGLVLTVEFFTLEKEMKDELTKLFNIYRKWLAEVLKDGKENEIFEFDDTPEQMALFVISSVEGALIFSRAYQLTDHYENVVDKIKSNLMN